MSSDLTMPLPNMVSHTAPVTDVPSPTDDIAPVFSAAAVRVQTQGITAPASPQSPDTAALFAPEAAYRNASSAPTEAETNFTDTNEADDMLTQAVTAWFGTVSAHQSALLDAMLNATTAHLFVTDRCSRHVYVGEAAAHALGCERNAILGKTTLELGFPLDVAQRWEEERAHALASGEALSGVIGYPTRDGICDFEYTMHPLPGPDGRMQAVLTRARDVTDHNRAERERQASEARFRSMIENALDTISILEANGTVRYESPAIRQILGYEPHEVIGKEAFHFVHPDDVTHVVTQFGRIMQEPGVVVTVEYRFRHKDGSWRLLESRGRNLLADPDVRGIIVNSRDITESKAAEQALRRHQSDIEALNGRLKQSIKETHHRVKNNLQIIAAMVDMQSMESGETISVEEFRRLGAQIRTLAAVHDVLTKEVKEDEQQQRISTRDVLTRLLPGLRQMARPRRVGFSAEGVGVTARQGTSLALVLNEIFLNALKHGKGDVQIAFTVGDSHARLAVSDQGPGFPPDFDPLTAANTGLELILSLTQTDLGGEVTFTNAPAGGALIAVVFPLLEAV